MLKRTRLIIFMLIIICLLTSCKKDTSTPKGAAALVGHDFIDGSHLLTLSIIYPSEQTEKDEVKVFTSKNENLSSAYNTLKSRYGGEYIFGSLQAIIIGESNASNSDDLVKIINDEGIISPTTPVFIANNANELISGNTEPTSPFSLLSAHKNSADSYISVNSDIISLLSSESELVPKVYLDEDANAYTEDGALIKNSKIIDNFSDNISLSVNLINSSIGSFKTNIDGVDIEISSANTKIKPKYQQNKLIFQVELNAAIDVISTDEFDTKKLLENTSTFLEENLLHAFEEIFQKNGADIFSLKQRAKQYCSFSGEEFSEQIFSESSFAISVKLSTSSAS